MDILGSIGMGAITGLVGPIITVIGNYKMKKLDIEGKRMDNAHALAMLQAESKAIIAEADKEIEMTKEKTKGEIEKAEIHALESSLKSLEISSFKESYMERLEKAGMFGQIAIVITSLALAFVDVMKGTMRPVLTYYLICATTWITFMAYTILIEVSSGNISQIWAEKMFEKVTLTVVYLTISCVTWWFADRRMAKFAAKHLK